MTDASSKIPGLLRKLRRKVNAGGICLFGERSSLIDFLDYFYPLGFKDRRVDLFQFEAEGKEGAVAFVTPSSGMKSWLEVAVGEMKGQNVPGTAVDLIRFPNSGGMVLGASSNFKDRWSGLNHAFTEIWQLSLIEFLGEYVFHIKGSVEGAMLRSDIRSR